MSSLFMIITILDNQLYKMNVTVKYLLFTAVLFYIALPLSFSQNFYSVSQNKLNEHNVESIVILGTNELVCKFYNDTCRYRYIFENSFLKTVSTFDTYHETNFPIFTTEFEYDDTLLIKSLWNREALSNVYCYSKYNYLSKNLKFKINACEWFYRNEDGTYTSGADHTYFTKYIYSIHGHLSHKINYSFRKKTEDSSDYSDEITGIESILYEILFPNNTEYRKELGSRIDVHETSRTYFIYNDKNEIIGFYPAKNFIQVNQNNYTSADTIYYSEKLSEISEIGFDAFSKKYLKGQVLQKVIDDSYTPILDKRFLVNGIPVKQFFKINTGKPVYLIFEVIDNNFLFYKITN